MLILSCQIGKSLAFKIETNIIEKEILVFSCSSTGKIMINRPFIFIKMYSLFHPYWIIFKEIGRGKKKVVWEVENGWVSISLKCNMSNHGILFFVPLSKRRRNSDFSYKNGTSPGKTTTYKSFQFPSPSSLAFSEVCKSQTLKGISILLEIL